MVTIHRSRRNELQLLRLKFVVDLCPSLIPEHHTSCKINEEKRAAFVFDYLANMTCCKLEEWKEQKKINKEIERQLKLDEQESRRDLKVLLLGPQGSGKSTFIKQMRIIHGDGYSDDELRSHIKFVYRNILVAMCSLIKAMDKLNIQYVNKDNNQNGNMIYQIGYETVTTLDTSCVEAIMSLWSDEGIQECYNRRREYELPDSAKYFLDSVERISRPDYLPSTQDILRVRTPTTGIVECAFDIRNTGRKIKIVDIGRQNSTRLIKWIHYFENMTAIFFLVAISEYDQMSEESGYDCGNQLEATKQLFRKTLNYPWFLDCSVILFLNKRDVLEEKIMYSHLSDYFPDFNGPKKDASFAVEFIKKKFLETNPDVIRSIYCHSLCAIDSQIMQRAFVNTIKAVMVPNLRNNVLL